MTYDWTCLDCKSCEICGQPDVSLHRRLVLVIVSLQRGILTVIP